MTSLMKQLENDISMLTPRYHRHIKQKRTASKLDPFRSQILTLIDIDLSLSEICLWLEHSKQLTVCKSTLSTRIKYWLHADN